MIQNYQGKWVVIVSFGLHDHAAQFERGVDDQDGNAVLDALQCGEGKVIEHGRVQNPMDDGVPMIVVRSRP